MSPGYDPGLVTKIHHLNVKDHVTVYKLMIQRWGRTIRQDVESNMPIFHLLLNGIPPKGSTSSLIKGIRLLDCLGDFDPILMRAFVFLSTLVLNQGDNVVSLLEDPADPPVKRRFISNLRGKCKLGDLKWVGLL